MANEDISKESVEKIKNIIEFHEMGGDSDQNLIQAADSISFLEINALRFIKNIPKKYTREQVGEKFNYMYNRIQIPNAKELAKPFYDKAMMDLEAKVISLEENYE